MHGIGNDYIYFDCTKEEIENPNELSIKLSDRHFGVGGDGIVLIMKSDVADFRMRMFNADGSEGKMCGNASRCIGKFVFDKGLTDKHEITLETLSGIKTLKLNVVDNKVKEVTVNMGEPIINSKDVPVNFEKETVINEPVNIADGKYNINQKQGCCKCLLCCTSVHIEICKSENNQGVHYAIAPELNTRCASAECCIFT